MKCQVTCSKQCVVENCNCNALSDFFSPTFLERLGLDTGSTVTLDGLDVQVKGCAMILMRVVRFMMNALRKEVLSENLLEFIAYLF
uniref:Uncharacterized protein n=1 Tax=Lactuca sativa TaxID=4236 RepID=A0A9R1W5D0_LACSA|nr:hypothetical protein LSAT_V11C300143790 [Lactuca sativa]